MFLFETRNILKITKNDLVIEDVSLPLLNKLHFSIDEIKGKHFVILFPKYFLAIDKIINRKKVYCLITNKERQYLVVKIKAKSIDNQHIILTIKFVENKIYRDLVDYQLFFNEINHAAHFGIIIFNNKGFVVHCNEAACKMYRYSYHEFLGIHGTSFIHSSIHNEFYRLIEQVKPNEFFSTHSIEVRKDNTTFKSFVTGKVVETKYGKFAVALVHDITKEEALEEELVSHKDLFKKTFDLAPVGLFVYDEQGYVTNANDEVLRQLDVPRSTLIGFNIHNIKNKELYQAILKPIVEKSNGEYNGYYTTLNNNKTIFTKFLSIPFRLSEKQYGLGISLDLSSEKRIENELRQKTIFFQKLFDNAFAGIGVTDLNENIIYANEAFAKILGYDLNDIIGSNLSNYTTPKQAEFFKKQTEYRVKNKSSIYEDTFIHKNGNFIKVLVHASPHLNEKNEIIGTIGVIVDITYQKYLINRINELEKINKQSLKENQFELETILKSLKSYISMLPQLINLYEKNKDNTIKDTINKYLFSLIKTVKFIEFLQQFYEKKYLRAEENLYNIDDFLNELNTIIKEYKNINYEVIIANITNSMENKESIINKTLLECLDLCIYILAIKLDNKKIIIDVHFSNNSIDIVLSLEKDKHININKLYEDPWYSIFSNKQNNKKFIELKTTGDRIHVTSYFKQNQNSYTNTLYFNENIYTTHLIKDKTILILSENEMIITLIKNLMNITDVNIIYPKDTNLISFIIENNFVDVLLIDTSIINKYEDKYNFIGLIDKFYKDVPRLFLVTEKTECINIEEICVPIDENIEKNIYAFLSKYVKYGESN